MQPVQQPIVVQPVQQTSSQQHTTTVVTAAPGGPPHLTPVQVPLPAAVVPQHHQHLAGVPTGVVPQGPHQAHGHPPHPVSHAVTHPVAVQGGHATHAGHGPIPQNMMLVEHGAPGMQSTYLIQFPSPALLVHNNMVPQNLTILGTPQAPQQMHPHLEDLSGGHALHGPPHVQTHAAHAPHGPHPGQQHAGHGGHAGQHPAGQLQPMQSRSPQMKVAASPPLTADSPVASAATPGDEYQVTVPRLNEGVLSLKVLL